MLEVMYRLLYISQALYSLQISELILFYLFSYVGSAFDSLEILFENEVFFIARKSRIWYPGAFYHLIERGIRKNAIFLDKFDYEMFTEIMRKEMMRHNCILHAYCLMSNHFHLLLETDDVKVGMFMRALAGKYATFFNHRYSYKGHVFEGRYYSGLVESDRYFLQTGRYIHLNPVRAGMVKKAEDYAWSSYKTLLGMEDDKMTVRDKTLAYFGKQGVCGYRKFVEDVEKKYLVNEEGL